MAATQEARRAVPRHRRLSRTDAWYAAAVGGLTFLLAFDKGGFALSSRAVTAIAVWWALLLGIGLGLWPRARVPRSAWITCGLLAAFTAWTFASIWWAENPEDAFIEFNRLTLYLGIFLLTVLAGSRANVGRWADGLTLGIVAIAIVSLLSRLFPHLFSLQGLPAFLPNAVTRLSFPIGYWNGLAIYVALAYPLCLRAATTSRRWWICALALAPVPVLSAVIYLTSSRGGVACALFGMLLFLAATRRRWAALGAIAAGMLGSILAIAILLPRHELTDGPVRSSEAVSQGRVAFFLILAVCAAAAGLFALGERVLGPHRPSRTAGRVLLAAGVSAAVAGVLLSHPVRRFEDFKRLPAQSAPLQGSSFVRAHLLSGSGSGRWQFWAAAGEEWKSAPLAGRGAGSYEAWWAQHASFSYFVRNAHSLYLEVLGELGLVGFLLLGGAFVYGGAVAIARVRQARPDERQMVAAFTAVLGTFLLGAGIEWIWQLAAVSAIGLVCLGLLTGPATAVSAPRAVGGRAQGRARGHRFAPAVAVLVTGWLLICAQAVPWLTDLQLGASASAVRRDDGAAALRHATDAKNLEPWAASPYLQLALVEEQLGHLAGARRWIEKAIDRSPSDWRLWLVSARIETKADDTPAARRSLRRAGALNPRSPLFAATPG
jgi:O-Antigen ligase/Tetratricopeptide repeat